MASKHREANRKKLLKLLSRSQLERLSNRETPWHMSRPDLETEVLANFDRDKDEIKEAVEIWIRRAFE